MIDLRDPSKEIQTSTFDIGRKLSNDIFSCIEEILPRKHWNQIQRLSVATGPGSFTGTRISITLCRTIAQQMQCHLDGISSFALMARRLHQEELKDNSIKPFWITSILKRRGIIGGLYQIKKESDLPYCDQIIEIQSPKLLQNKENKYNELKANYDIKLDTIELLKICHSANKIKKESPWQKVLPIYPCSPVDENRK